MRRWLIGVYLVGCAWQSHQQARVWVSDLTLWRHAARMAPLKPRPALNYGSSLAQAGDVAGAASWWAHAAALAQQPHVPSWDAQRTMRSVLTNLRRLREAL